MVDKKIESAKRNIELKYKVEQDYLKLAHMTLNDNDLYLHFEYRSSGGTEKFIVWCNLLSDFLTCASNIR